MGHDVVTDDEARLGAEFVESLYRRSRRRHPGDTQLPTSPDSTDLPYFLVRDLQIQYQAPFDKGFQPRIGWLGRIRSALALNLLHHAS